MFKWLNQKIEIQIHSVKNPNKSDFKRYRIWQIIVVPIVVCCALLGLVFFNASDLYLAFKSPKRSSLSLENENLEKTIAKINKETINARQNLSTLISLKNQVNNLADVPKSATSSNILNEDTNKVIHESLYSPKSLDRIRQSHNTFETFLKKIQDNPKLSASIPILHPVRNNNTISVHFGMIKDRFTGKMLPHRGVDFVTNENDTIIATGDGVVLDTKQRKGFGYSLTLKHTPDVVSFYSHLSDRPLVKTGQKVKRGTPIALVGKSGRASGPHLHYEIRVKDVPINPENYFITR